VSSERSPAAPRQTAACVARRTRATWSVLRSVGLPCYGALALGLPLIACLWIAVRAASAESIADFVVTTEEPPAPTAESLAGAELISFASASGDTIAGCWRPGTNGKVIVFGHGSGANRSQLYPEAEILSDAGYSVLLFDWPGHGRSTGTISWAEPERQALRSALDWLQTRQPGSPIGMVAFSLGTLVAAEVASMDERISAIVLEGALGDLDAVIDHDYSRYGVLSRLPARYAARWHGYRPSELPLFAHRSSRLASLFVAGGKDPVVPPELSRSLFDSARSPKQFWLIPNATHGHYATVVPHSEFATRLTEFFNRELGASIAGTLTNLAAPRTNTVTASD
jgi:pimeloyl-ACP methyl ester carboxylesterase